MNQIDRIATLLAEKYALPPSKWVFLTEVRTKVGWSTTWGDDLDSERFIDALAFCLWPSSHYQRIAYEFKTTRADWLAELSNPVKKAPAYFLSHEFWYVVLPGVVDFPKDITVEYKSHRRKANLDGCGIIEIQSDDSLKILVHATKRQPFPMPETFVASLLRRAAKINNVKPDAFTLIDYKEILAEKTGKG